MSVIIRLQNLPWTANALDIRRFFSGLSIPDGGVHIVGGDKGDAFIAFSTDEDARRAMLMDGGRIGTNALKLFLSSKTEMQNVIALARGSASSGPSSSSQGGPPMGGPPPQSQQYMQPMSQQQGPSVHAQNYGPPSGHSGFIQGSGMMPQQNMAPQVQMRGMSMDQRIVTQDVPAPFGSTPPDHMGRPNDQRPMWDHRDIEPRDMRDRGDFGGRRDIGPAFDHPREMGMQGLNGGGNMDMGRMINEPINDFNNARPREDFRGPSPRRESFSPMRDRFDDRRERRKRVYEDNLCVFLSNMPVPLNYRDVRSFFTGIEIPRSGLKLINDRSGQRIGEAFVMFTNEDSTQQALRMDGWMTKGSRVRIEPTTLEAFENAVDSYVPNPPGGPSHMHERPMMNKRKRSRSPPPRHESLTVVVKNLPYSAEKREVLRLFSGIRFAKGDLSVHFEHGKDGKPLGTALIELFSEKDLKQALSMHRQCDLNGRTVEVIHIDKNEFKTRYDRSIKLAAGDKGLISSVKSESKGSNGKSPSHKEERNSKEKAKLDSAPNVAVPRKEEKMYCVKLQGVPFDCEKQDIEKFFSGFKISQKGIRIVYQPNGKAFHTAYVEFVSSDDCKRAVEKNKEFIGQRYILISPVSKMQMMEDFHSLTDQFGRGGRPHGPSGSDSVANQVGNPGCVVSIQNLHFNATLEDILHFFRGLRPIANSVKMRYNQDGRPMGDAMLAFHSPHDADMAVREMDGRSLMGRQVALAIM